MKKRFWGIAAVLCLMLCLPAAAKAEIIDRGQCGDNVTWTLDDAGTLTVSGEGEMEDKNIFTSVTSSQIKQVIIKDGITKIGNNAFRNFTEMTEVTIPDGVTSIGEDSFFNCMRLKSLNIPDSVVTINKYAFIGCEALEYVKLSKNLKTIDKDAFAVCYSLKAIDLPQSLSYIGAEAFASCRSLTEIEIPELVTSLPDHAFARCENLKTVTIPRKMRNIGSQAFEQCGSLTDVYYNWIEASWNRISISEGNDALLSANMHYVNSGKMGDNIIWILEGDTLTLSGSGNTYDYEGIYGNADNKSPFYADTEGYVKKICVQEGITGIGDNAFSCWYNVEYVTLPDSLTRIGSGAFYRCQYVKDFTLSEKITEIADDAFEGFINSPVLHVVQGSYAENYAKEHSQLYEIPGSFPIMTGQCGENAFFEYRDDTHTLTISGTGELYEYEHRSEMGSTAPWHGLSERVKKVVYEEGIKNTSSHAFTYFELDEISLPSTLVSIDDYAFTRCRLDKLVVPENVSKIGTGVTYYTRIIVIPKSVLTIAKGAFSSALRSIYYAGSKEDWSKLYTSSGYNENLLIIHYNSIGTDPPKIVDMPTVTYAENGYTIDVPLDSVEYDSRIIAVAYDDGRAAGFGMDTLSAGDTEKFLAVSADSADSVKIFIWDSLGSMKPIADSVEVKI